MALPRHPPPPTEQQQAAAAAAAAAAAVHLPDFHADSPQSWFTNLDSQFATANITQSLTKFHWAVAKLPFSLSPTIQPLADDPTAVADPYGMLKELLLESYGLTEEQKTSRWLDYPMCGSETRPLVLWDNLTALRPKTLEEAQIALFIRKLPRHISAMINTKSFDTPKDMIRRCNQLWATQTPEEAAAASATAAAATAGPWQHSSLRNAQHRRSPSPGRRKTPGGDRTADPPPPLAHPRGSQRRPQRRPVLLPRPFRQQGPQVREGLHLSGKLIGRRPAQAPPPPPVLSHPATPPSVATSEFVTAMSAFPTKNLNFFERFQK
jgi:hypothetical protein